MKIPSLTAALLVGMGSTIFLAACGGISDLTRERVSRSETAVQQAQQPVGRSEAGAVELQRAKDELAQAQQALNDKDAQSAERHAEQAELDAQLAMAKAESTQARKAADELLASIEALRREASRDVQEDRTAPPPQQ